LETKYAHINVCCSRTASRIRILRFVCHDCHQSYDVSPAVRYLCQGATDFAFCCVMALVKSSETFALFLGCDCANGKPNDRLAVAFQAWRAMLPHPSPLDSFLVFFSFFLSFLGHRLQAFHLRVRSIKSDNNLGGATYRIPTATRSFSSRQTASATAVVERSLLGKGLRHDQGPSHA
jgi:hypothetical protein